MAMEAVAPSVLRASRNSSWVTAVAPRRSQGPPLSSPGPALAAVGVQLAPGAAALHAARGRGQLALRTQPPGLQRRALPPGSPLPRVSPNSSFSSFPSPRDRNSCTGYRGLEQEPFLPRGRFIRHMCNATVLHANSCGVIFLCSLVGIFMFRVDVFVMFRELTLSIPIAARFAAVCPACVGRPRRGCPRACVRAWVRSVGFCLCFLSSSGVCIEQPSFGI